MHFITNLSSHQSYFLMKFKTNDISCSLWLPALQSSINKEAVHTSEENFYNLSRPLPLPAAFVTISRQTVHEHTTVQLVQQQNPVLAFSVATDRVLNCRKIISVWLEIDKAGAHSFKAKTFCYHLRLKMRIASLSYKLQSSKNIAVCFEYSEHLFFY